MAKVSYGQGIIYPIDSSARQYIEKQWRLAVTKAYNIPYNTDIDRIYKVTL